jgi:hypothetical protein
MHHSDNQAKRNGRLVSMDAWILALVFVVSWVFRFLSTTSFHNDQYMHLAWANQVLAGEMPIRDFVDPGMPLTYLASAVAQLLLGRGVWAEAVLSFTLLSAGAALTCYLARRASGSLLVGLIAALVQVVIAPRLYSAPKILLPLCAVWAFWCYADRPSRRSLAILAACTATAFLVRHDHGVYIWAAASVLLVHLHWPKGALRVATYSGSVALILLPFFAYVQWNEGIVAYVRAGLAFTEAEYNGRRVDLPPQFDLVPRVPQAPLIIVRWAPTVGAATRGRVEAEHSLQEPAYLSEQTWQYRLADQSAGNVRNLVNRREVEDTAGIDRAASQVSGVNETMLGHLSRAASQRGAGWLTALLKRQNAIAWIYLLFTSVPLVVLVFLGVGWLRPSWGFHSGQMAAPVVVAAAVLGVATNQGFLRDPLDVRLADASAVTLILSAWLAGRFRPSLFVRATGLPSQCRALWPRSVIAATAMTIAVVAAGATLLGAAELGSLHRALEKALVVEGPRVMASGAWHISDLDTYPPIEGWLTSGDEQHELKVLTRYVRECTRPDDRLLVTWFAPEVYFYAERPFAAGLAFFYPGFFSSPAEEELALARLQAQVVPIVLSDVSSYEQSFVHDHPLLAAHLAARYAVAGEVSAAGGRYRVLTDRRAVPVRVSSPWSLPCFQ